LIASNGIKSYSFIILTLLFIYSNQISMLLYLLLVWSGSIMTVLLLLLWRASLLPLHVFFILLIVIASTFKHLFYFFGLFLFIEENLGNFLAILSSFTNYRLLEFSARRIIDSWKIWCSDTKWWFLRMSAWENAFLVSTFSVRNSIVVIEVAYSYILMKRSPILRSEDVLFLSVRRLCGWGKCCV
jgi:hypothetical protein